MNETIALLLALVCVFCAYVARKMSADEAYQRQLRSGQAPPVRPTPGPITTDDPWIHDTLLQIGVDCQLEDEVTDDE